VASVENGKSKYNFRILFFLNITDTGWNTNNLYALDKKIRQLTFLPLLPCLCLEHINTTSVLWDYEVIIFFIYIYLADLLILTILVIIVIIMYRGCGCNIKIHFWKWQWNYWLEMGQRNTDWITHTCAPQSCSGVF